MNVLVTGGAGYLGAVVTRDLLSAGHNVRVLDSLLHGDDGVAGLESHDGFELVEGDIRSGDVLESSLEGVEAVVHLAAIVGDPACKRMPDVARDVNLAASLDLYERSVRRGVARLVFTSTCSNYGRMADPETLVDEESELSPLSIYAETKVSVEQALLVDGAREGSPSTTVLRLATLFGLSPRMRFDLTVNEFSAELLRRGRLAVYGEQFWRPYVHVRDAAAAIRLVLESPREAVAGHVYNVGDTRENYQKQQLVDLITQRLGKEPTIEYVTVAEDPRDYRVSFDRIAADLQFEITTTVPQGIDEVLAAVDDGTIRDPFDPRHRN